MSSATAVIALIATAVNTVAGAAGLALWWQVRPHRWAWALLRGGQITSVALAAAAGVRWAVGPAPEDGLFYLYAALPVAVAFVAEQLRLAAADSVLEARGLADGAAVGELPGDQQRSVVRAILRRELGVVAAAALVCAFLALRAWGLA